MALVVVTVIASVLPRPSCASCSLSTTPHASPSAALSTPLKISALISLVVSFLHSVQPPVNLLTAGTQFEVSVAPALRFPCVAVELPGGPWKVASHPLLLPPISSTKLFVAVVSERGVSIDHINVRT